MPIRQCCFEKKIGIGFVLGNYSEGLACLPSYYFHRPTSHYTFIHLKYATKCACSVKTLFDLANRKCALWSSVMFDIFFNIVKMYLTRRSGSIKRQRGLSIYKWSKFLSLHTFTKSESHHVPASQLLCWCYIEIKRKGLIETPTLLGILASDCEKSQKILATS